MGIREQLENIQIKPQVKETTLAGVRVFVRKLSWGELKRVQELDCPTKQVCAVLCDEDGSPVYSEEESHHLARFHADDLKGVLDVATAFNSLDEQVRQAKND